MTACGDGRGALVPCSVKRRVLAAHPCDPQHQHASHLLTLERRYPPPSRVRCIGPITDIVQRRPLPSFRLFEQFERVEDVEEETDGDGVSWCWPLKNRVRATQTHSDTLSTFPSMLT
jgi:hypothetical protein